MSDKEKNNKKKLAKVTKEGRLYFKTKDFFSRDIIKRKMQELEDSSIVDEIERNKRKLEIA